MPPVILDYIEYITEYQYAKRIPFTTSGLRFWEDPRYEGFFWKVPIVLSQQSINQFYPNSEMVGAWMKLTLAYSKEPEIFIKNIVSSFNINKQ